MPAAQTTAPQPPTPQRLPVGFGLNYAIFAAPAIWIVQLLVGYILTSYQGRVGPAERLGVPIGSGLWWALIGIECASIIGAILAVVLALAKWRHYRGADASSRISEQRNRQLAVWALWINGLFGAALVFTIIMLFVIPSWNV